MPDFLIDGRDDAKTTVLLAHGAGAPMDSPFMNTIASLLAEHGLRIARFEFAYMAARRSGAKKRPAPKAESVIVEYHAAIDALAIPTGHRLVIGGKSMGGRVASMLASEAHASRRAHGLVCIGYPFHPPNTPTNLRTAHLEHLTCPTLVIQGERDPFGTRAEIEGLSLSPSIAVHWIGDGDHDLGPRGASGFTRKGNLAATANAIAAFSANLKI